MRSLTLLGLGPLHVPPRLTLILLNGLRYSSFDSPARDPRCWHELQDEEYWPGSYANPTMFCRVAYSDGASEPARN